MLSMLNVMNDSLEDYLIKLIQLTTDPSVVVRQRCLQGISNIMDYRVDLVLKYYKQIYPLMIERLKEFDQKVALAAAEFWSGIVLNDIQDDE